MNAIVSEADVKAYERDGAIVLNRVFASHWLESLADVALADRRTCHGFHY